MCPGDVREILEKINLVSVATLIFLLIYAAASCFLELLDAAFTRGRLVLEGDLKHEILRTLYEGNYTGFLVKFIC